MPFIQLPGDSTGKLIETVTPALSSAGSTMHREVMAVGDYTSTAIATVTSSGGLQVAVTNPSTSVTITNPSTSVTVTNPSTAVNVVNTVTNASASSGNVGVFASTSRQYIIHTFNSSSSNTVTVVTTLPAIFYGWNLGNQTTSGAVSVKIYNTSSGAVGSTAQMQQNIAVPGGSAGAGNNFILPQGISCTGGITFAITANFAATSTGSVAANDVTGSLYYNT